MGFFKLLTSSILVTSVLAVGPQDVQQSIITFDTRRGAENSLPLNEQLIGMSIEFCYIVDFIGDVNSPNKFTRQLLQNVEDRSGHRPILRLGGNTQDLAQYCEDCPATMNNTFQPPKTEAIAVTYSKKLFKALNENMSPRQQYIFGLNLGNGDINVPITELKGALKYLNQEKVVAYELGNEPDHYADFPGKIPVRPSPYGVVPYANEVLKYLPRLAGLSKKLAPFQLGSMAINPIIAGDFTLAQLNKLGVPAQIPGIKIFSSHSYQGQVCTPAGAALVKIENYINHLSTVQFYSSFATEIAAAKAAGAIYHMGETNSAACHGKDGVSNTMGALLWEIDYVLLGATMGMDRLFFHGGKGDFFYSFFEPVALNSTSPAHINPTYYSLLFHADLIAGLRSPRILRIAALDTYDLAHYAVYERGDFRKMVILNTRLYNVTEATRPSKKIDISPVMKGKVKVLRLTAPLTISKTGTTFGTQSVGSDGRLIGKKSYETYQGGVFQLGSSEAVIVERDSSY